MMDENLRSIQMRCEGCIHNDKTEHEYPCCICTRLEIIRRDRYRKAGEGDIAKA